MESRPGTLSAFHFRDFTLLWSGLVSYGIGQSMQQLGMGWLIVTLALRDGVPLLAPFYIGLVGLASSVTGFTGGLLGGVVSDRTDRRSVLLVTQSVMVAAAAVLAVLAIAGLVELWMIMLFSATFSAASQIDLASRQAMVPALVPQRHLLSAIGLNTSATQGATFIGPLIGGLLIIPIGVGGLFAVHALLRLVIVGCLLLMRPQPVAPSARRQPNVFASIGEGFAYLRGDAVMFSIVLVNALFSLTGRGYQQLMPAVAQNTLHVGAVELSWMLGAGGLGTLVGSLGTAAIGAAIPRRGVLFVVGVFAAGVAHVLFAFQDTLLPTLPLLAAGSFATSLSFGVTVFALQTRAANEYRGRVISVHLLSLGAVASFGTLMLGSLGTAIGVSPAIGVGGVGIMVVALAVLVLVRPLREFRVDGEVQAVAASRA